MKLRIGIHDVEVVSDRVTDVALAGENLLGDSDTTKLLIRVRSDLPASVWHDTLVHEALHHALAQTPLAVELSDELEERLVRALAPYLVQLGLLAEAVPRPRPARKPPGKAPRKR